jgi:hypothetical protein
LSESRFARPTIKQHSLILRRCEEAQIPTRTAKIKMKHRIQIIGLVVVVVVQGLGNLWTTANHNAQVKASTEAHNAQLMAQAKVHNAQLLEFTERFNSQLSAQAAASQKQ